ncbi:hypothetical protein M2263_004047 [Providencia alcalifaciens]|nr:hypothetical protein [Providencia alcalifaciens]
MISPLKGISVMRLSSTPSQSKISVILRASALLPTLIRTSHIVIYAPSDSYTWRLAATRIIYGKLQPELFGNV